MLAAGQRRPPSFCATTDGTGDRDWDDDGAPLCAMGGCLQSHVRGTGRSLKVFATLFVLCLSGVWLSTPSEASSADWQEHIRRLAREQELEKALFMAEDQLADHPEDLEARGWRARLLAWTHRWNESEIEYRTILESAPHDIDILLGLVDLLTWQGRSSEAIVFSQPGECPRSRSQRRAAASWACVSYIGAYRRSWSGILSSALFGRVVPQWKNCPSAQWNTIQDSII